jgi:hypothetical protein
MYSYLDDLPITPDAKGKLADLAAPDPMALLSLIEANPTAIDKLLGPDVARSVTEELVRMLGDKRGSMAAPLPKDRSLGAVVDAPAPKLRELPYDLGERERLFQELEFWRSHAEAPEAEEKIDSLTNELESLLAK